MWSSSLRLDLRLAIRRLRRSPAFFLGAAATVGVALAASSATIRVWRAVEPSVLGVPGGDLIHALGPVVDGVVLLDRGLDTEQIAGLKKDLVDLATASGVRRLRAEIKAGDVSRVRFVELVDADYFGLFLHPLRFGRAFADADHGASLVVLSDRLARQLVGDPSFSIGATVTVAQQAHVVIGVASPGFLGVTSPSLIGADAWVVDLPSTVTRQAAPARAMAYVRPHEGRLLTEVRARAREAGLGVLGLRHALMPGGLLLAVRSAAGGVGLVILSMLSVAVVGLLALLVSRAIAASEATYVRQALGASGSLARRPFLIEGVLVVVAGTLAALPLGQWLIGAMADLNSATAVGIQPFVEVDRSLDTITPALGVAVSLMLVLIVGRVLPSSTALRHGGRSTSRMLGIQIAFSALLVSTAGLAARGASQTAAGTDWPFGPAPILARLDLGPMGLNGAERSTLVKRLQTIDLSDLGIESSTLSTALPIGRDGGFRSVPGRGTVRVISVEPDFFEVYSIPLRGAGPAQSAGVPRAIVSQAVADWLWPDGSAIGRVLVLTADLRTEQFEVVGVAATVELAGSTGEQTRQVYLLSSFDAPTKLVLSMKSGIVPVTVQHATQALRQRLPDVPVEDVRSLHTELQQESRALFTAAKLTVVGAGFSALVTLVGVYSVARVELQSRFKDIGVMMAMGAGLDDVWGLISRPYRKAALSGILAGSVCCLLVAGAAKSLLPVGLADIATVLVACGAIFTMTLAFTLALPLFSLRRESPTLLLRDRG